MEYCNQCGNKIEPDDAYCTQCGSKIERVPDAPTRSFADERTTDKPLSTKIPQPETKDSPEDPFDLACQSYVTAKYDDARQQFLTVVQQNADPEEVRTASLQLRFLKSNPLGWIPTPLIIFFVIIVIAIRDSRDVIDFAEVGPYFLVGLMTLYWVFHSLHWPAAFQAKIRFQRAMVWLWLLGVVNTALGALEYAGMLTIYEREPTVALLVLLFGVVTLLVAILSKAIGPRFARHGFLVVSVFWAYATADEMSFDILAILAGDPQAFLVVITLIHLYALSTLIRGMGAAKILVLLESVDVAQAVKKAREIKDLTPKRSRAAAIIVPWFFIVAGAAFFVLGLSVLIFEGWGNEWEITVGVLVFGALFLTLGLWIRKLETRLDRSIEGKPDQ